MLRHSSLLVVTFLLMATFSIQTQAQSVISGDITGTITDPSGANIPNAAVTITNESTNTSRKTTTNAEGSYRFAFVAPGTYQVNLSASGFQNQARSGIAVTAGQPTTASMQLVLSGTSQTVIVEATGGLVQSQNADVATNYNSGI